MNPITTSILAFSLLTIGIIAAVFIFIHLGRPHPTTEHPEHLGFFRCAHRICGYIFFILYLFIAAIMFKKLEEFNMLPPKAVIHSYIGITILPLLIIKICIVRLFKRFYSRLPVYGMILLMAVYLQVPLYAGLYIISTIKSQYVVLSEKGKFVMVNAKIGRQVVQRKCSTCHSLERVYAYAKTEAGWRDYVSRMRAKDPVILNDAETLQALGYLIKNLGIDETKMDIQVGMKIILEKCHKCHTLERVFTFRKTQAEWAKTIELMRSFDPYVLNDSESHQVNYYLSNVLAKKEVGQGELKPYQTSWNQNLLIK